MSWTTWTGSSREPILFAGHYDSKAEFLAHTFEKLEKVLPQGAELYVEHLLVSGNWAVVELRSNVLTPPLRMGSGSTTGTVGYVAL